MPKLETYDDENVIAFSKLTDKILTALSSQSKNYNTITFSLYQIYIHDLFVIGGYDNFVKFSQEKFNFKKTQAYAFVNVAEKFGHRLKNGEVGNSLEEQWSKYDFSKLVILTALTDAELANADISPDMSVKEIRKLKKKIISERTENLSAEYTPDDDEIFLESDSDENSVRTEKESLILDLLTEDILFSSIWTKDIKAFVKNTPVEKFQLKVTPIETQ